MFELVLRFEKCGSYLGLLTRVIVYIHIDIMYVYTRYTHFNICSSWLISWHEIWPSGKVPIVEALGGCQDSPGARQYGRRNLLLRGFLKWRTGSETPGISKQAIARTLLQWKQITFLQATCNLFWCQPWHDCYFETNI